MGAPHPKAAVAGPPARDRHAAEQQAGDRSEQTHRHDQHDILAEIGFVVLVGLAAKNAILIVEFARQAQDTGSPPADAAVHAAQTRMRPILMTSPTSILGVAPLVFATGAGAEMRQSLVTAVFGGMLGVTGFGLIFTPAFYTLVQRIGIFRRASSDRRDHYARPDRGEPQRFHNL